MNSCFVSILFAARNVGTPAPKESDSTFLWIGIAVLLAVAAGGAYYAHQFLQKSRSNSPAGLFLGLCRLHGLDSKSRHLLQRVAQYYQIEYAARLFVEPSWLDAPQLAKEFPTEFETIGVLRAKLFS